MSLKVKGREHLHLYKAEDDFRIDPVDAPKWQDSTWLQWWDLESGCGGVHRIGHEYNVDGGPFAANWSNLITPKGIYKHVTYQPLREKDKMGRGWGSGDDTANNLFDEGKNVWNIHDTEHDVSACLAVTDYHDAFNGFPGSGPMAKDISSNHIDVSGAVTGTITMQGETFNVNGMGLRDHGWGTRDLGILLSHRYITGCFGPELSFVGYAFHTGAEDSIQSFGWAVKGDTVVFATDVDIVVYAEVDSASTRGGHITLTLADGDVLECEFVAAAPGMVNGFPYFPAANNTLCRAQCNGKVGVGMIETSMNFRYGSRTPERMQRAIVKNGFYPGNMDDIRQSSNNPFVVKNMVL